MAAMTAGTVNVECPICGAIIPATVSCRVTSEDDGTQLLVCDPDMTDLWAHAFAHQAE